MKKLVALFDDERNFVPSFRDDAIVIRDNAAAKEFFLKLAAEGTIIEELWLDFALKRESVADLFFELSNGEFPGHLVEQAIYHSSAASGFSLIAELLKDAGFTGELSMISLADRASLVG